MNALTLVRKLAFVANWPASDIEHRARKLREAGFLPQGGHGRHAPDMRPYQAVNLLLGIASSHAASHVVEQLAPRLSLVTKSGAVLADVLADVLSSVKAANQIEALVVSRSRLEARIEWRDGHVDEFAPAKPVSERSTGMRCDVTIDRMVFKEVAEWLSEPEAGSNATWGDE